MGFFGNCSGLDDETDEAWGHPFLCKHRTVTSYCGCGSCEGHDESFPLPESEWYWKTRVYRIDMGSVFKLEEQPSSLFRTVQMLGKDPSTKVDWLVG